MVQQAHYRVITLISFEKPIFHSWGFFSLLFGLRGCGVERDFGHSRWVVAGVFFPPQTINPRTYAPPEPGLPSRGKVKKSVKKCQGVLMRIKHKLKYYWRAFRTDFFCIWDYPLSFCSSYGVFDTFTISWSGRQNFRGIARTTNIVHCHAGESVVPFETPVIAC